MIKFTIACAETSYDVYHYDEILKKYWYNREERIIVLKDINELINLQKELNNDLILGNYNSILIYDYYIE